MVGAGEAETMGDALDIHYIESCKMLTSCSGCDKIIEINRLTAHMLDECSKRDRMKMCRKCKVVGTNIIGHECISYNVTD